MRVGQYHEPGGLRHAVFKKQGAAGDRDLVAVEDANERRERIAERIGVVVEQERQRCFC